MCSCCQEPLDLRIESKKLESDVSRLQSYYREGYESSGTENSSHRRSFHGQAFSNYTIDHPHGCSLHSTPVTLHPASRQPSPISDEGFVDGPNISEEHLPNFEKIQNPLSEAEQSPSGKRSPSSPRDKKSPSFDKERRKPGRKPGHVSNILHLWEFMRDLLRDPSSNNNIVQWVSRAEGVFKVVNSNEVARLWGEKKNNKKQMTYEKLSRSLRYSRLEGYFSSLPKDKNYPKKLCFKFGPKSKDWH